METFKSRNGKGPQMAELIYVVDGMATLRMLTGKRRETWQLTERFLRSPLCGWKPSLTPNRLAKARRHGLNQNCGA